VLFYALYWFSALPYAGYVWFLAKDDYALHLSLVIIACHSLSFICAYLPVKSASSVLVLQILHCLEEGLDSYARMTESANAGNAQFLAEVGMDLDSLLEGANADLGGLIIAEYVSSLFSAVYGIFFSTTLASVFYQGEWQWAIFLFSLYNVVLSVIFILRLVGFQRIGQKMQNHCARIKIDLQNTLLRELPSKARHHMEVAVERFSKPAPIRPLDVFNLNLASGASIVGLILTYIIVLLQFKVSEDRGDTSTTINHVSD